MKMMWTAFACALLAAANAGAHAGGHGDEMQRPVLSEEAAKRVAQGAVGDLVKGERIEPSWQGAAPAAFERIYRHGEAQWLATFKNQKAKKEKEIFIVLTIGGDVVGGGPALDEKTAKVRAREELVRQLGTGKVPTGFKEADPKKIEKRQTGAHWQWVATFEDAAQAEHKQVFIILFPYGELEAVNFTGK